MTSKIQIFTELSNIFYLIDIFLLCNFQVIWVIQTELFYRRLNFQDIGKFKQIVPTDPPPRNRVEPFPIGIVICTRYIMNIGIFWRVFLFLFKFLITFCTDFVTLFVINFGFKISRFGVLNKAVLGRFFDQLKIIVLVAPQKYPLAKVLPVRQNEIV